ncbi:biofilm PGA synthesis protein PgaC [Acidilutibacter cellobiosedens]|uniref:Biofilm PGA synthesis protein PgaC n=1 Tax=Acidilutibacter cellobiosedens TaxID=2507161 RepID=A0A410QGI1_9FIRM|nr:BPL-N domain-containing protein [Acidilutibacter cellobiosedens]QAT63046.1 biofilm PGA synthesis protein PgaC [Acidilutibacter cellobiosedens]
MKTAVLYISDSTSQKSYDRIINIIELYGISVKGITEKDVVNGELNNFDVLIVPGGRATGQAKALGEKGCSMIESFVKNSGGYIGICAGAFLAVEGYNESTSNLVIVNAQAIDIDHWNRGSGNVKIKITDPTHPIINGYYGTITAYYENGPLLKPGNYLDLSDYDELAFFADGIGQNNNKSNLMINSSALVSSTYGYGKCVLFSFHPELTEGLQRMFIQGILWAAGRTS